MTIRILVLLVALLFVGSGVQAQTFTRITDGVDIASVGATGGLEVEGEKGHNTGVPGTSNIGTLIGVATAVAPTYIEGNQVGASFDLDGALRIGGRFTVGSASGGSDLGTLTLVVRDDVLTTLVPADGNHTQLRVNSLGALHVVGAVGTTQYAEGTAHVTSDSMVFVGAIRRDTTPTSSAGVAGQYTAFNADANGRIYTNTVLYDPAGAAIVLADGQPTAGITGGATLHYRTSAGATEDKHEIKATPGTYYGFLATNVNAEERYLRCYNLTAANTTPGTSTVAFGTAIPGHTAGAGASAFVTVGAAFTTAWTCTLTTGAADTDTVEVAANEIKVNHFFK